MRLALEDWGIWRRWELAFYEGQTSQESHPTLPEDRQRKEELALTLDQRLKIDPGNYIHVSATVEVDKSRPINNGVRNFLVEWIPAGK